MKVTLSTTIRVATTVEELLNLDTGQEIPEQWWLDVTPDRAWEIMADKHDDPPRIMYKNPARDRFPGTVALLPDQEPYEWVQREVKAS